MNVFDILCRTVTVRQPAGKVFLPSTFNSSSQPAIAWPHKTEIKASSCTELSLHMNLYTCKLMDNINAVENISLVYRCALSEYKYLNFAFMQN